MNEHRYCLHLGLAPMNGEMLIELIAPVTIESAEKRNHRATALDQHSPTILMVKVNQECMRLRRLKGQVVKIFWIRIIPR